MRRFKQYTIEQIEMFLSKYEFKRQIYEIHFHHTWKPTKQDYLQAEDKEKIILGMWKYHTDVRGFSDIAQHFTVAPDGTIWDGRDLEKNPASIYGRNNGAISIEHIGNFDEEKLEGVQLEASIRLIVAIIKNIKNKQDRVPILVFHREYSDKTCPGLLVDKGEILKLIDERLNYSIPFKDVTPDMWSYEYIKRAAELGLIKGDGNGNFKPKDYLTREQGVVLIMRLYDLLKEAD
ncbi:S-layer homology domain-containing protein [Caloranaerobacter azorensis]|uniref:S-layer homology domain-containing protein n=1 Tax=Caloranaerobacter azorensis TaxID=116090 RepID=UPI00068EAC41|nr:S-layer homology domain-containing protein [Caloranaerobacter azorensis]